jgi:hypothetical protein
MLHSGPKCVKNEINLRQCFRALPRPPVLYTLRPAIPRPVTMSHGLGVVTRRMAVDFQINILEFQLCLKITIVQTIVR